MILKINLELYGFTAVDIHGNEATFCQGQQLNFFLYSSNTLLHLAGYIVTIASTRLFAD